MCELLGAALDEAVCKALSLPHVVEMRPTNPPRIGAVWLTHNGEPDYTSGPYQPNQDSLVAMNLQFLHDIAVYPDPDASGVGAEKWVAGFNWTIEQDEQQFTFFAPVSCMDHAARGATPAIAICRTIVQRHLDAEKIAAAEAECEAQALADEVETERLQQVRALAWHRAEHARLYREAPPEFENVEARAAYVFALDQQLDIVRRQNKSIYGDKA